MSNETKEKIVQKQFEADNMQFQIEGQQLKVNQIERMIKMNLPLRTAEWDLAQAKKQLNSQKRLQEQIIKGIEVLKKQDKK